MVAEPLDTMKVDLEGLIAQITATVPNDEPFGLAHSNWSFPNLTRSELIEAVQRVIDLISDNLDTNLGAAEPRVRDYSRRLQFLRSNTIPNLWGNPAAGVPALLLTLRGLEDAVRGVLPQDDGVESARSLKRLKTRISSMEARLREIEPKTASIEEMVSQIEQAYDAADRLPETLESLVEYQQKLSAIERVASKDHAAIEALLDKAKAYDADFASVKGEADGVLARCESAYSAATSVGLAAAFSERSQTLSDSIKFWVGGLLAALSLACGLGIYRIIELSDIVKTASPLTIALNVLISALAVGAPVWFAWLATKQIGQRFRLSEDYAFKASVSRAYEGYSREAARVDKELEARLLASALNRLDEQPLRVVEPHTHSSPVHELASSKAVAQALKSIPGFADDVKGLAARAISSAGTIAAAAVEKAKPRTKLLEDATAEAADN
ncbi:hypothetical protein [Sphingobium aromaticivastans]|uniref:hypothetical protein n=1 Tax=Sphingobium aromaticivastans TaxID=1778665 RepID=UPI003AFB0E13